MIKLKHILFATLLILGCSGLNAQETDFQAHLVIINSAYPSDPNGIFQNLYYGVNSTATNELDKDLGEFELFPSHPPSGLHAVFEIPIQQTGGVIWSYKDFRPPGTEDIFEITYTINVQKGVPGSLRFAWEPMPKNIIDSAVLRDNILGTLFNVNLMKGSQATCTNDGLNKFEIKLWVRKTPLSVQDAEASSAIFPNPFGDELTIINDYADYNYEVRDLLGSRLLEGSSMSSRAVINAAGFAPGFYYLIITDHSGNSKVKKIIKANK